ncbi:hypothetical protein [Chamaesiphon sp. VAR_48_metabat_135_sub]|uniref:hypothetical protein n=1 Tax=Chamaesiphon sp. VAR_48_metabat_135_sub TaxID=2964699 RepID=UPI00286D18D8|nr:hypothetical protein [Chamaesiphon sp. VAR_48_metabat_135_sub]
MLEKIILAIAITFSLSWSVQIKPQPRVVAMGIDAHWDTVLVQSAVKLDEPRSKVFVL